MSITWKRVLALSLSLLMVHGAFAACGAKEAAEPTTVPTPTEDPEEARVLKILTLGHSLALDACHMLAMIAVQEGYEGLKIGTLYNGSASLAKHVEFLTNNSNEYTLYISSTDTPDQIPAAIENASMYAALVYDKWDIIIMQSGTSEAPREEVYTNGNIQKIQEYVNQNKTNPNAIFAWNMTWAPPTDNTLRDKYPISPNIWYTCYEPFNDDRSLFYSGIAQNVKDHILTDDTFAFVIPSATAIENALSSHLEETDLHRDYAHASDLGRVVAAYTWLCTLMKVEKLEGIKLDKIPVKFFKSTQAAEDRVLTEAEKAIILEAVNNAIANPLQMTPSQYTVAP